MTDRSSRCVIIEWTRPGRAILRTRGAVVFTCSLCRFTVPLDDTLVATVRGTCICLRCYLRAIDDGRRPPRDRVRQVAQVAAAA